MSAVNSQMEALQAQSIVINPPYPADLEAKGWALDLDYEKIEQSDTWSMATARAEDGIVTPELRPWLLMTWMVAWKQVPIASFPQNDKLIAARIGMPVSQFIASKDVLLSGFELATDGRMYHRTLCACALKMAGKRDKDRSRVAAFRAKLLAGNEGVAPSNEGVAPSNEGVAACNALHEATGSLPTRDSSVSSTPLPTPLLLPEPTPTPEQQKQEQEKHAREIQNSENQPENVKAAIAMKAAGIFLTPPNAPGLLAAIAEGVTAELLGEIARLPKHQGKTQAYIVQAALGQLRDARANAKPKQTHHGTTEPQRLATIEEHKAAAKPFPTWLLSDSIGETENANP